MKNIVFAALIVLLSQILTAQVSKTVNLTTAGSLSTVLTINEITTITKLTVTGVINKSDIQLMNAIPLLTDIDLSGATIEGNNLEDGAFSGKTTLINISLPSSLSSIGGSFQSCTGLKSVTFQSPSSLTTLGNMAFYACTGLTSFTVPSSVTTITHGAFYGCSSLSSVTFESPVSLTSISDGPFHDCSNLKSFTIPATVTSIDEAFLGCTGIESVSFEPASQITTIGESAFSDCPNLTSVSIPSSVQTIGRGAFSDCPNLKSITIPSSVTLIDNVAFQGCTGLTTVNFSSPSALKTINFAAFTGCSGLQSINLPNGITTLGELSFVNCTGLTSVEIPGTLTSIGNNAFLNTPAIFTVDTENSQYSSFEGILMSKNQSYLHVCTNYKTGSIQIPSSVVIIGNNAFKGCNRFSSISIPQSVMQIKSEAFADCTGLTAIYSHNPVPPGLQLNVFSNIDKVNCTLYVPENSVNLYKGASQWKDFQKIVKREPEFKMPLTVTAGGLETLIPQSVRDTLTYLSLVGTIDARDFITMRDLLPVLANIDLSGVSISPWSTLSGDEFFLANEIPRNAFYNHSSLSGKQTLTTCILPSNVTTIGLGAFSNCINLSLISLPSTVTKIGDGAFSFCKNLSSINIPPSVTEISNQAFYFCSTSFLVHEENPNYSSIDGVLFDKTKATLLQCPISKTGIYTIPSSVTNLGSSAFSGCIHLSEIIIPQLVKSIGYMTFSNCSGLVKVNIPSSVTDIQPYAFQYCRSLRSITIPSSVNQIGGAAFDGCIEISSIYALKTTPVNLSYSSNIFNGIDKATCILYVPAGSENLYASASQWSDFINIIAIPAISKTINLSSPGTLTTKLTEIELSSATNLTLTGTIDARDFKTMRDLMPNLSKLDLSGAAIAAYTGTEGTFGPVNTIYPANEVPRNAFLNRTNLTMVTIPESAKTIGRSAFNNCDGLTQVTFEVNSQLTKIGYLSFANCDYLTDVQIPASVKMLDYGAFYKCFVLTNMAIPQAVDTIGSFAFYSCKEILNFNIPSSTKSIGMGAFIGATGNIVVDENNPGYSSLNGVLYDKNKTQLIYCPPSTSGDFVIPKTVSTIAVDAFYNCSELTSIDIPDGLITLEDWVFENCTGLTTLSFPQTLTSIGSYSFYNCSSLSSLFVNNPTPVDLSLKTDVFFGIDKATCKLFVPAGSESLYATTDKWKDFVNISSNKIPVANAGSNQTVNEGTMVTLDGSASFDENGVDLNYLWNAPAGILLSSATVAKPTFTAPEVKQDSVVVFILVVNNGNTYSVADTVTIIIKNTNKAPVANVGPDLTVIEGKLGTLNGSASSDYENDILSYLWTAPAGITLSSNTIVNPTFTAPEVKQDTVYMFSLVVNDGNLSSEADLLPVTIKNVNKTPFANAGSDQSVSEGIMVTLDGSASYDNDDDMLTYLWTAHGVVSLSSKTVAKPTFTAPEVKKDSVFVFSLVVNDGSLNSIADSVLITVRNENKAPVANAGPDQMVSEGVLVTLDGLASFDDDGDKLTYLWTAPGEIKLSSAFIANPTFIAPEIENDSVLVFSLVVNDGKVNSVAASVNITVKKQIASISLKTLFGNVEALPGQVYYKLFREIEGKFTHVAISEIQNGNTAKYQVEPGNWLVLCQPSIQITDYVPTYFGNSIDWNSAQLISLKNEENFSGIIVCKPVEQKNEGNYTIEGFVYETTGNKNAVIATEKLSGEPLPGVSILLFSDEEEIPLKTTTTDENGKYTFENLSPAIYHIKVEIPGFTQSETWNIKLEGTQEEIKKVNFTVITNLGIITDVEDFLSSAKAYPNPTRGVVYVVSENPDKNSHVNVYSSTGVLVLKKEITNSYCQIDLCDKTEGLYILSITSGNKTENIKIILKK